MPWLKLSTAGKPFVWANCQGDNTPQLRYTPDGIEMKPVYAPDMKSLIWECRRVPTYDMIMEVKRAKEKAKNDKRIADEKKRNRSSRTSRARKRRAKERRANIRRAKQRKSATNVRALVRRQTRRRSARKPEHGRRREAMHIDVSAASAQHGRRREAMHIGFSAGSSTDKPKNKPNEA
jgi:hypothetical protein